MKLYGAGIIGDNSVGCEVRNWWAPWWKRGLKRAQGWGRSTWNMHLSPYMDRVGACEKNQSSHMKHYPLINLTSDITCSIMLWALSPGVSLLHLLSNGSCCPQLCFLCFCMMTRSWDAHIFLGKFDLFAVIRVPDEKSSADAQSCCPSCTPQDWYRCVTDWLSRQGNL